MSRYYEHGGYLERDVLSYGGGVQSAAIAVLIVRGKLPKPDAIVMADTGREATETWEYLESVIQPLLAPAGLRVEIASHDLATVDLRSSNGRPLIPAYTEGGAGKLPNYCSVEWKRRVVQRWLRAQGYEAARLWLGISKDEVERAKPSPVAWIEHHYPLLLDIPMSRADCLALCADHGLPQPPRSSCWMCPYRSDAEWLRLKGGEDWGKAVALDEALGDGLYLHRSGRRLASANLGEQQEALDLCDGYCWT